MSEVEQEGSRGQSPLFPRLFPQHDHPQCPAPAPTGKAANTPPRAVPDRSDPAAPKSHLTVTVTAEPLPCPYLGAALREAPAAPAELRARSAAGQGSLGRRRCPAGSVPGAVPSCPAPLPELRRTSPARSRPVRSGGSQRFAGRPWSPAAARPTLTARVEWQCTWWDTVAVWFMLPAAPGGLGAPAGPSRRLRAAGGLRLQLRLRLRLRCSEPRQLRPPAPPRPAPPRPPDRLRTVTERSRLQPARGWGDGRDQPRSVTAEPCSALS